MSGITNRIGVRAPLHAGFAFPRSQRMLTSARNITVSLLPMGEVMFLASPCRTGSLKP
jgi:hypothetical protein